MKKLKKVIIAIIFTAIYLFSTWYQYNWTRIVYSKEGILDGGYVDMVDFERTFIPGFNTLGLLVTGFINPYEDTTKSFYTINFNSLFKIQQ